LTIEHGGDVYSAAEGHGCSLRQVMDFSASVNPLGPSKKVKAEIRKWLKMLNHYPDPKCRRLRKRIRQVFSVPEPLIICGNGSNELIFEIVSAVKPHKVLVTAPSFSEYAKAASRYGAETVSVPLCEEHLFRLEPERIADAMKECQVAFVANPLNPSGTLTRRETVLELAEAAARTGCMLVLDEAFIDFCQSDSVIRDVSADGYLGVLRSLTKFHGLAGLRVGFAALPERLIERIHTTRDPWSVNTLAQRAAYVAIGDTAFSKETMDWLGKEKTFLEERLGRLGFVVYPSSANYLLVNHKRAPEIREGLFRRRILVRDCSNFEGLNDSFLRIAVHRHPENTRLLKALSYILNPREPRRGG